jgi:hypothetical protein
MADDNNWTARQFNPKHKHTLGVPLKNGKQQPTLQKAYKPNTVPVNIWKQKAAEPTSAQPKTTEETEAAATEEASQGDNSIESIWSQLTEEQEKTNSLRKTIAN